MIDESGQIVVDRRPTLSEALEVIAALKDYAGLQEASGQTPSAVLSEFHNALLADTATAAAEHPEAYERVIQAVHLRTRLPA